MAQTTSDMIEKMLPDKFIEDTVKSFEDLNKAEKKKDDSKKEPSKENKETKQEETKGLPSAVDQEQMNKMFEQLIKPEVKSEKKTDDSKKTESKGYDNKETKNLDRLIDITAKN